MAHSLPRPRTRPSILPGDFRASALHLLLRVEMECLQGREAGAEFGAGEGATSEERAEEIGG